MKKPALLRKKIQKAILYMYNGNYIYSVHALERDWGIGHRAYHTYLKKFVEKQTIPNSMGKPRKRLKLKDSTLQLINFWEENKNKSIIKDNLIIKKYSLFYYIN